MSRGLLRTEQVQIDAPVAASAARAISRGCHAITRSYPCLFTSCLPRSSARTPNAISVGLLSRVARYCSPTGTSHRPSARQSNGMQHACCGKVAPSSKICCTRNGAIHIPQLFHGPPRRTHLRLVFRRFCSNLHILRRPSKLAPSASITVLSGFRRFVPGYTKAQSNSMSSIRL